MVSQQAIRFYKRIGYHPYEGITEDFGERERILKALGTQPRADPAEPRPAHGRQERARGLRPDEVSARAATIQLKMEATGGELIEIPPEVCEKVAVQYERTTPAAARPTGRPICA